MSAQDPDAGVERWRVYGRVQGVGFRWWTRRTAESLGLSGSVRNCSDGTVEVKAAGDREALERLGEALEAGPSSARVERVETEDPDPKTNRTGFHIHR